jgi:hypothetical protein
MLNARDMQQMQAAQEASMPDECQLLRRTDGAVDAYGVPAPAYAVAATVKCGLSHSQVNSEAGGRERRGTQVPIEIRRLRLPADTSVSNIDRVSITRRFGASITPVLYEIVGDPQRGPSGLLVQIQKVTE